MQRSLNYLSDRPSKRPRRVLILNGNETQTPYRVAPLGLAFIASAIEQSGREVRLLDHLQGPLGLLRLRAALRQWQPDVVAMGLRNLDNSDYHAFQTYLSLPARLVTTIRKWSPNCPILLGGSAGTVDAARVMDRVQADHLILGEGEEAVLACLQALESGERLERIIGAGGGKQPFRIAETRSLPAPRLHRWTSMKAYLKGDAGYPVQTKRGCPLKCTYCTYGRIEGARYRRLAPEAIADEIEGAMEAGIHDFEFVDSTFNLPPGHAMEVVQTLLRRGLKARYHGTGINPSVLREDLLDAMYQAGFRQVILTAESASASMLRSYGKNYTPEALERASTLLQKYRLGSLWVFLLAGPGETPASVEESLEFIAKHIQPPDAVYITSGIRIYQGSPMADAWEEGRLAAQSIHRDQASQTPFHYSSQTPPEWLEARLRSFQREHAHVMLSCEGHDWPTRLALSLLPLTGLPKPYWQYLSLLNAIRRPFRWKSSSVLRPQWEGAGL